MLKHLLLYAGFFCLTFQAVIGQPAKNVKSDIHPHWSPDGLKIAFASNRNGNYEIYVKDLVTQKIEQLSDHPADDFYPAWSPKQPRWLKEPRIAFFSERETENDPDHFFFWLDGSTTTQLPINSARDGDLPSWSPDGKHIAFHSNDDLSFEIYTRHYTGKDQRRLTFNLANDIYPFYSPDGEKILFLSDRNGNFEIYLMNTDGSNQKRLTYSPHSYELDPIWSPDGSKIAFTSDRAGNFEIYVMDADGKNPIRLTEHDDFDLGPIWSPDGKKILFSSNREDNVDIYSINADGTNLTRITTHPANDFYGSWSEDGKKIIFCSNRNGSNAIYMSNADGSKVRLISQ